MDRKSWANIKKSGYFKKKLKNNYTALLTSKNIQLNISTRQDNFRQTGVGSVQNLKELSSVQNQESETLSGSSNSAKATQIKEEFEKLCLTDSETDCDSESEASKNDKLRDKLRKWAIRFNITQHALRELNQILNDRFPCSIPKDPRTFLNCQRTNVTLVPVDSGHYWHNGLINTLKTVLQHLDNVPECISLNVNIDGLPLFKSSKHQVWPILCNIHEFPNIPPLVVGVYEGTNKPVLLNLFLQPFIDELLQLYRNNLKFITRQNILITTKVKLRAVICDSPARALIKGNVF